MVRNREGVERRCRLLPTSTMGAGAISEETIALVDALRAEGVKFVIITGARTTTLHERMPLLCKADAVACETGSKILYPPPGAAQPCAPEAWTLDTDWVPPPSPISQTCRRVSTALPPLSEPRQPPGGPRTSLLRSPSPPLWRTPTRPRPPAGHAV